jgi:aspartyl protease family protein
MVMADNQVQLVGQFGKKAVVLINGVQRIIKINQASPEGVKLLQVEPDYIVVLDNGQKKKVTFSTQLSTQYDKQEVTKVNIWADSRGSYITAGSINGQVVQFLVDTGATSIAMNEVYARQLGIDFRYVGQPVQASTASGVARGYAIKLDSVKVGSIQLRNVEAVVLEGGFPARVLLGMSFLKHVSFERENNLMTLKYKK